MCGRGEDQPMGGPSTAQQPSHRKPLRMRPTPAEPPLDTEAQHAPTFGVQTGSPSWSHTSHGLEGTVGHPGFVQDGEGTKARVARTPCCPQRAQRTSHIPTKNKHE